MVTGFKYKVDRIIKFLFMLFKSKTNCEFLVFTPYHGNLGDHAIALSEICMLEKAYHKQVQEIAGYYINKMEKFYGRIIPSKKTIFVNGGGILGSLWKNDEEIFHRILLSFPHHRIVVFPQTIYFDTTTMEGMEYLKEAQRIYSGHSNLTIFAREEKSYLFLKEYFPTIKSYLVPDIALLLDTPTFQCERKYLLVCFRKDREAAFTEKQRNRVLNVINETIPDMEFVCGTTVEDKYISSGQRETELTQKLQEFAQAKLVITDRLHAMIFSAITGTPCLAFDNKSNKVKGVYKWLEVCEYIRFIEAVDAEKIKQTVDSIDLNVKYKFDRTLIYEKFEELLKVLT